MLHTLYRLYNIKDFNQKVCIFLGHNPNTGAITLNIQTIPTNQKLVLLSAELCSYSSCKGFLSKSMIYRNLKAKKLSCA